MGKSKRLNGRWIKKDDRNVEVVIEKVYKKGYVTGYQYERIGSGMVHSPFKTSHDVLQAQYKQID